jgi:hypothetical protein
LRNFETIQNGTKIIVCIGFRFRIAKGGGVYDVVSLSKPDVSFSGQELIKR